IAAALARPERNHLRGRQAGRCAPLVSRAVRTDVGGALVICARDATRAGRRRAVVLSVDVDPVPREAVALDQRSGHATDVGNAHADAAAWSSSGSGVVPVHLQLADLDGLARDRRGPRWRLQAALSARLAGVPP